MPPSLGQSLRYGLPGFTLAFAALPLYLLTPALYAQQFSLHLGLIGLLLMLTRLTDAIADPFIGKWIDASTRPTWIWLSAGLLTMSMGLALLTNPGLIFSSDSTMHEFTIAAWLVVCTLVVSLSNSVATLAHQGWAVTWTADVSGQARLIGAREACGLIGVITAAAIAGQQSGTLLGAIAITSGLIAAVLTFGIRASGARSNPSARQNTEWSRLFRQPKLRELLLVLGTNALANAIPPTLILFFLQDLLGATALQSSSLLVTYFIAAAIAVPAWSWAVHRFNPQRVWIMAMAIAVAAFAWTLSLEHGEITAFAVICVVTGLALGAELVCPAILLGRRIDLEQHRGVLEASYFGIWNLVLKLALALAAGLSLPILAALDFTPGVNRLDNNTVALQWAYAGIPCLLKCLAIGMLWRYRDNSTQRIIDEKE